MHLPKTEKHFKIAKARSSAIVVVAVATVIVVFCAVSAKALLNQGAYQRRVVNAKHDTVAQLQDNISAANSVITQYGVFNEANPNAIGGKSDVLDNAPPPDGKNSRIIQDALPVSYDFPALISSISKLLTLNNISEKNIGGTDQSADFSSDPLGSPKPITIEQIPVSGSSSYAAIQNLVKDFERSIRPFDITSLQLSGNDASILISLKVNTYYQPATSITLEKKVVK